MGAEITGPIIGAVIALIGFLTGIYFNNQAFKKEHRLARNEIIIKHLDEERADVRQKLREFYLPLRSFLNQSETFYKIFIHGKPDDFRTLPHLLYPEKEYENFGVLTLTTNDNALLREITAIGQRIRLLINEKQGIIDDGEFISEFTPDENYSGPELPSGMTLLGLTNAHLCTIKQAFKKKLVGESDKYAQYVYPRMLNEFVDNKISELNTEIKGIEIEIKRLLNGKS